jgi:hypothetical protein
MNMRRLRLHGGIAAVLIALLMLAAASSSLATTSDNFSDGPGDGNGAPDILVVTVDNDASGEITFTVLVLGNIAPPADAQLTLVLDTDRNKATGSNGFDYALQFDARFNEHALGRWDGTQFPIVDAPTAAVNWTGVSATFSINRSDLGGTNGFDFYVRSTSGGPASDRFDDGPNEGTWSYTLATAPTIVRAVYPPTLRARPGKVLDARGVRVRLSDGTTIRPETLTCRLTVGRTVVKPLRGGCRWRIGKTLKGRTVVLTIVARHGGDELRATRRLVVR